MRDPCSQLSIQRPHVDLIFSRDKPGQNMWTNQFLFVPPEGRWVVIHDSGTTNRDWKSQVPNDLHKKVSKALKQSKSKKSSSAGKLRGLMLLGQPMDGEDASEMMNGSKWVRTETKENGKETLRSIYFPILDVIELPSDKQVHVGETSTRTWVKCVEGPNLACEQLQNNAAKPPPPAYFEPEIKQSHIHGSGVFATRDYEKGRYFMGTYAPDCVARKIVVGEGFQDYALKLGDGTTVTGFQPSGKLSRHWSVYVNHSKNPHILFNDDRSITQLRPIKKGEELFVDYGYAYWKDKLLFKDQAVIDALLMSPDLRTPTQRVSCDRFGYLLKDAENRREKHMKQMDPEYEPKLTETPNKKRKSCEELVIAGHLQGLKLKDEKWFVYWINRPWPTIEPFETVSHLTDLVGRCHQHKGVVQYRMSQLPVITAAPAVAIDSAIIEQKVEFQGVDYSAVNCVANAVKISKDWYNKLKQDLGVRASLAELLSACRRGDSPVQIDKVKLPDNQLYEYLRNAKEEKFLIEVQGTDGRHILTWDAERGKIASPHPNFPFEMDAKQDQHLIVVGISAKTVKIVMRLSLKNKHK